MVEVGEWVLFGVEGNNVNCLGEKEKKKGEVVFPSIYLAEWNGRSDVLG